MIWQNIKHFKHSEFDDPEAPGSWIYLDPVTVLVLDRLREQTGWPIITHNKFGIRGCVCVSSSGHSKNSYHYKNNRAGCSAVDWHFVTDACPREQAMTVLRTAFNGIGVYYDWHWDNHLLPVGFHTDLRPRPQIWKRVNGKYIYFLA